MQSFTGTMKKFRSESGSGLVETSLSLTLLMLVIFAILDSSRALLFDHYVAYSAREAARYAMVRGSTWKNAPCTSTSASSCTATSTDVTNFVAGITPMGNASDLMVNTAWSGNTPAGTPCASMQGTNSPGCLVTVQVSYSFNFVLPFLPKGALVLRSSSAMPIAQ